jgi:hypothetical protein
MHQPESRANRSGRARGGALADLAREEESVDAVSEADEAFNEAVITHRALCLPATAAYKDISAG